MIEIKNIHKKFHQKTVLNGVDLSVSSGTIQALLGANGAGKSTLINILSFLIHKNKGKISIDGEELNVNSYKYRSKVGYVFEHPIYVDDFSAEQYLHFVGQLHKLERANYESKTEELLTFFSLPFDKKSIKNYSKGMKTKVSLAAALIHEPSYLVLDEPLDGMDFSSIQKTIELLKDLSKKNNCTILIASHQYDLIASACDKLAFLKDGKIIFNLPMYKLEEKARLKYSTESNPIKSYLEGLISVDNNRLSWIK